MNGRKAISRKIADALALTTSYQDLAYPTDLGAVISHGGQVVLTFERTSGTSVEFKIAEKFSGNDNYIPRTEDDGTDLNLIERTSTEAKFSYAFTTLAEKIKVSVKGAGSEVLTAYITVGEVL